MKVKTQVACPNCRVTVPASVDGNVLDTPLVCPACGQTFSPHFYCPDADSPARHVFAATRLHVDSAGALYAFCPEHTFTTYALAADSRPRPRHTLVRLLVHFLDSLVFRLTLAIAGLRWRATSRQ